MKVYLTGAFEKRDTRVGFGNAAHHIYKTMKDLGVDVYVRPSGSMKPYEADIEICFDQPDRYIFLSGGYHVGYTPWESTEFIPRWWRPLQACDEVWTTSFWNQNIFEQKLPHKPIFTYRHGIDHRWKPIKKVRNDKKPFTFLFVGEPYNRKDGGLVTETFIDLFGNNPEYRLIIKGTGQSSILVPDPGGTMFGPPNSFYDNIIVMTKMLTATQMVELYDMADVFVYPTWGEGFGFNPLQAMARGIPTIATHEWSDYAKYITVPVDSYLTSSPWPDIHPGYMLKPDSLQFRESMALARSEYDHLADVAFRNSFAIHKEFDWHKVTKPAIKRLENIYASL